MHLFQCTSAPSHSFPVSPYPICPPKPIIMNTKCSEPEILPCLLSSLSNRDILDTHTIYLICAHMEGEIHALQKEIQSQWQLLDTARLESWEYSALEQRCLEIQLDLNRCRTRCEELKRLHMDLVQEEAISVSSKRLHSIV